MDLKGKSISVDGLKIRYVRQGEGDDVLLIHGLGAALDYWDENIDALSRHFRVTAFDLPWFGKSSIPVTTPSLDFFLATIRSFCHELGIEKTTPVGNSLGGALAAAFAGRHPELVDKLILISPGGFGREVSGTLRLLSIPLVGGFLLRPTRTVARQAIESLFHDRSAVKQSWIDDAHAYFKSPAARRAFLRVTRESIGILGQRSGPVSEITRLAGNIRAQTLVMWGDKDGVIPDLHLRRAVEIIPDCRSYVFEECGHVPMMERPKEFNQAACGFLLTGRIEG